MRRQTTLSILIGGTILAHALMIWAGSPSWGSPWIGTSQEEAQQQATSVTRRYSNVKWSAERNTLVGANIIVTRQGDRVSGTYVLFDGSDQGTSYRLTGTARGEHIQFTVRASGMTLRFSGRMTEEELVGKMTLTRPDGTREEREFKARRLWR